jgi:hypothetical protein
LISSTFAALRGAPSGGVEAWALGAAKIASASANRIGRGLGWGTVG